MMWGHCWVRFYNDAYVAGKYQITNAYQERTIDPDNFYSLVLKTGGLINTVGYTTLLLMPSSKK